MLICEWMQQCAWRQRPVRRDAGRATRSTRATFDIPFQNIYNGGGLIGIRAVETRPRRGDKLYLGVAEVLGSDGHDFRRRHLGRHSLQPKPSASNHDAQVRRSDAGLHQICSRCSTRRSPTWPRGGTGPARLRSGLRRQRGKWIEAAHTLKARIYLHQVEKLGNAQYTSALAEARKGISAPANDWKTAHSSQYVRAQHVGAVRAPRRSGRTSSPVSALVEPHEGAERSALSELFAKNSAGDYVRVRRRHRQPDVGDDLRARSRTRRTGSRSSRTTKRS